MSLRYPILLLLILPAIFFLAKNYKYQAIGKKILFPFSGRGFSKITTNKLRADFILTTIRLTAFSLIIFSLARPQSSSTSTKRSAEGIDIMIALDVSKSMTIEDYEPYSRLDMAKNVIKKFVAGRKDDRIGFLMFSGESVTLCPPTLDYDVLNSAIEAADTESLKDGTAIGDALANAAARLKDSKAKSRIIILMTDGDNNMGSIAPLTAGGIAQGYGIKVYTIALGREGIVKMPSYTNFFGQVQKTYEQVNSTINPELLVKIAEETNGKFFRPTEINSVEEVFREINKLERTKVETKQKIHWDEHFQNFLLPGLLLLILDFILARTRFRVLPN